MTTDVSDLQTFYASPLGEAVGRLLSMHLGRIWPSVKGETLLALGFAQPFLAVWREQATHVMALAVGSREADSVPCSSSKELMGPASLSRLPLMDGAVDRILVVHGLEGAEDADGFLHEIWRVLKGQGRVILVVPNRSGWWAHCDKTPFGTGVPYSSSQLRKLLRAHGFMVQGHSWALYLPPSAGRFTLILAGFLEKSVRWLWPSWGGVLIIEASKQLYAPLLTKAHIASRRPFFPLTVPAEPLPAGRGRFS